MHDRDLTLPTIKGSVFCEFTDSATVDQFLKADPKPSWEGNELVIMSKEAYVEMKIKEKGLTGKAIKRDNFNGGHRTFDAFREMKKTDAKTKPAEKEVILEFLGTRLRIQGTSASDAHVQEEEVPRINHTTLRFSGCGGECPFDDVKGPLKERYARAPFIKYERGEDSGLVGFDRALTDEDVEFVRGAVKTINGKPVTWEFIEGEAFYLEVYMMCLLMHLSRGDRACVHRREGAGSRKACLPVRCHEAIRTTRGSWWPR